MSRVILYRRVWRKGVMKLFQGTVRWSGIGVGCLFLLAGRIGGSRATGAEPVDVRGGALASGRAVANAVIWLAAPDAPRAHSHDRVVMDQRNLTFIPHVLAVRTGTTVEFP